MSRAAQATGELVSSYQRGQNREGCARLLFRRYHGSVCGFFRRKGFSYEDSQELAEEVFFSVFRKVHGLRDPDKFEGWMFQIARNIYRNELERRGAGKRTATVIPLSRENGESPRIDPPAPASERPDALTLRQEKLQAVRQALGELPTQMRRCLFLRLDDEMTYEEIAKVMGISINTVSAHLHQARKALKGKLSPYFGNFGLERRRSE